MIKKEIVYTIYAKLFRKKQKNAPQVWTFKNVYVGCICKVFLIWITWNEGYTKDRVKTIIPFAVINYLWKKVVEKNKKI